MVNSAGIKTHASTNRSALWFCWVAVMSTVLYSSTANAIEIEIKITDKTAVTTKTHNSGPIVMWFWVNGMCTLLLLVKRFEWYLSRQYETKKNKKPNSANVNKGMNWSHINPCSMVVGRSLTISTTGVGGVCDLLPQLHHTNRANLTTRNKTKPAWLSIGVLFRGIGNRFWLSPPLSIKNSFSDRVDIYCKIATKCEDRGVRAVIFRV
jgi:uncharacterized protein with PQ loop repeat